MQENSVNISLWQIVTTPPSEKMVQIIFKGPIQTGNIHLLRALAPMWPVLFGYICILLWIYLQMYP